MSGEPIDLLIPAIVMLLIVLISYRFDIWKTILVTLSLFFTYHGILVILGLSGIDDGIFLVILLFCFIAVFIRYGLDKLHKNLRYIVLVLIIVLLIPASFIYYEETFITFEEAIFDIIGEEYSIIELRINRFNDFNNETLIERATIDDPKMINHLLNASSDMKLKRHEADIIMEYDIYVKTDAPYLSESNRIRHISINENYISVGRTEYLIYDENPFLETLEKMEFDWE